MRTTHSFAIDFIIRRCKENKDKAMIFARITVDGERKEISLKEIINSDDWNNGQQKLKGKSTQPKGINNCIDDARFRLKQKYRALEESGSIITAETIKQAYLGVQSMQKQYTLTELLDYYYRIWKDKLKDGSLKNYRTTIAYLKLFVVHHYGTSRVFLSRADMQLATEFEYYLRNNPIKQHDPCRGNGVAKHIQRLKRILNWAVEIDWLKINPVEKYSCPLKRSKRKKLDIRELLVLQEKAFQDKTLNLVKDLFIFSCYTGLAYADVIQLKPCDIQKDNNGILWCRIFRQKTDGLSQVPLLKPALAILNKYEGQSPGRIFPYLTNQAINRCLKVMQEACAISVPLTFHIARHTFAKTIALKNGVPLESIQLMLGHSKISTTQIYADVDEEKILQDMQGIDQKLIVKREYLKIEKSLIS
ncbi:MAG TPA: site-specific integrase [Agriterribacter sp.]|nr:site-specific integrase [Agriterribacter sp.]